MTTPIITDADLAEFRAEAVSEMTSRANVRRITGRGPRNPDTGAETSSWAMAHAGIPFNLKGGRSRTITIGGIEFTEATAEGHLPADTFDLIDEDLIEVTAGEWAGTVWRVLEAVKGDRDVKRRLPIVEAARPPEWDTP